MNETMQAIYKRTVSLVNFLGSSTLALYLVILVIVFSVVGAVLPQEGMHDKKTIELWQAARPFLTDMLEPIGMFHVFSSWLFTVTIVFLGINTALCTVTHFFKEGGLAALKGPSGLRTTGFLLLHLSLVLLCTAGFLSTAAQMDATIVLTEGQQFEDRHENYVRISEGPLHSGEHTGLMVRLKKVVITYEKEKYAVDIASTLEFLENGKPVAERVIRMNHPVTYKGITFTQGETGFSPRIAIREKGAEKILLDSFVGLKTFDTPNGPEYRDFLQLPNFINRFTFTLFPSYSFDNKTAIKTGDVPDKPLLLVEIQDSAGKVIEQSYLPAGKSAVMGGKQFQFRGLRRWSTFRVTQDPGYAVAWIALWLGTIALLLRYLPDLQTWFQEGASKTEPED